MDKFHIGKNGLPSICKAKQGNCPLGGEENHFNTKQEAYKAVENRLEEKYKTLSSEGKVAKYSKSDRVLEQEKFLRKNVPFINSGKIEFGVAKLSDKFDIEELERQINIKNVAKSSSQDGLYNLKYSSVAAALQQWNDVTLRTRGLVVNENNEIIARGFNKFFNLSEVQNMGIDVDLDEPGVVMDKLDGSLGLVYKHNGKWKVSTAGGLGSEQAIHATKIMNERYSKTEKIEGKTMLVEIIYPENRIVTDYGDKDDLFLLGGADNNGYWLSQEEFKYDGPRVDMKRGTIREALETKDPEDGTEGFIVRLDSGLMVKIKYPKYLQLHKAKFNFSRKNIWQSMVDNNFTETLALLPDEFQDEAKNIKKDIEKQQKDILNKVDDTISKIPSNIIERKDKAIWLNKNIKDNYIRSLAMTKELSGRPIEETILKNLKPNTKKR